MHRAASLRRLRYFCQAYSQHTLRPQRKQALDVVLLRSQWSLLVCVKERYFTAAALSFLSPTLLLSSQQQQRVHARRPARVRRDHGHGQPPPPTLLLLCLLHQLRLSSCRDWTDCVDQSVLQNDGMPRVKPPRTKDAAANALSHVMVEDVEIEIHGATTSLFEEVDPFRKTSEPSSSPS